MRSRTGWNCGLSWRLSWRWPQQSAGQWLRPARPRGGSSLSGRGERRSPWSSGSVSPPPGGSRCRSPIARASGVLVGTADGRVHSYVPRDEGPLIGLDLQSLRDPLPCAVALPAAEQVVDPAPRAVPLGNVPPGPARLGQPPYPVDQLPTCPRPRTPRPLFPPAAAAPVEPTASPSGPLAPHHEHHNSRSTFATGSRRPLMYGLAFRWPNLTSGGQAMAYVTRI